MRDQRRTIIRAILVLLAVLTAPLCAVAQNAPACNDAAFFAEQMSARLHRVGDSNVLVLSGGFDRNSARTAVPKINNRHSYSEVWLCSPGGLVDQGIKVGEAFNKVRATVRVPKGYRCVSACTIAQLGGYVRIIDEGGDFVIHASSAYSGFGLSSLVIFDCDTYQQANACGLLASVFQQNDDIRMCDTISQLRNTKGECLYIVNQARSGQLRQLAINSRVLLRLPADRDLVQIIIDHKTSNEASSSLELLEYYQTMLLDGRKDLLDQRGYQQMRSGFRPHSIYDPSYAGLHARKLDGDIAMMKDANVADTLALWQLALTDMELSVKRQMADYLNDQRIDLGPAGPDAINIFDAMITCQIQSLCFLEPHHAEVLGYHNFFDAE